MSSPRGHPAPPHAVSAAQLEKAFRAVADPAVLEFEVFWIPATTVDPGQLEA